MAASPRNIPDLPSYVLDDQIGFVMRQVQQRHVAIFADRFGNDVTTTQWAAIAKLAEIGECSQNLLGRHTAMDVATIKGVVGRLIERGLIETHPDPADRRRLVVSLSAAGQRYHERMSPLALRVTEETLAPLSAAERSVLDALLRRLR